MLHKYVCRLYRWTFRFTSILSIYYILLNTVSIYTTKCERPQVAWGNLFREAFFIRGFLHPQIIISIYKPTRRPNRPPTLHTKVYYNTYTKKKKNLNPETAARRGYRIFFLLNDRYRLMPRVDSPAKASLILCCAHTQNTMIALNLEKFWRTDS